MVFSDPVVGGRHLHTTFGLPGPPTRAAHTVTCSHMSARAHFVHRVREELQMASKDVLLLLTSLCAEVVILRPKDTQEVCGDPDRTETLQAGTCFSGRRVCGFQGFFSRSRTPWQGRHAAVCDSCTWKGRSAVSPRPGPMMHPNAARCRHWAHQGLPGHAE